MQVQIKTSHHDLSVLDREELDRAVDQLDRLTKTYEMRHLHVDVSRVGRTNEVRVKMVLALARRRLVCDERGPGVGPAARACAAVLSRKVALAKDRVHRSHGERSLRRAKAEAALIDVDALRASVAARDLDAFRDALREAPGAIEAELGRRLKRHPDAEALLGDEFLIADLVEGVIVRAYDGFAERPASGSFQEWLWKQIDPVVDELVAYSLGGGRTS
jgi:hypothetical protein